ncbi:bifunctional diguanylate cyclase/phosphodiesterase [Ammoniphilus sp. CFH 90114]|uniref:sensor domain-containing protein n=1 Tax=Ammoniphilus sp. CFH 90114 TaxID=2493665 RepID=UPI00100D9E90|nr:bifunctional diguanylate cyclase/phosphodiesterase [Ammoniphilus sp. CFH 90114]RXT02881.1 EAL domain-containing protein [Ammoniphilus sp. CFH 90114]
MRFLTLEQSIKRYKEIEFALNASTILAITDERGMITDVNDAFCRISQYSREELVGQSHRIINSGHHPPVFFQALWETIRSGSLWEGEVKNRAKDGSCYWVKTTIVPLLNEEGKPYQYISIRTDISEQKRMKEQLRESEQSLSTLIDAIPDFVCFKDGRGAWIKANEYAQTLYELKGLDYQGKTDLEIMGHDPLRSEPALLCMESDEETWNRRETVRSEEVIPLSTGENLIFDVIKVPVFRSNGDRKGLVVVGRDITERKKVERLNEYLAYSDPLTHVPNRRFFEETLDEMLQVAADTNEEFAVLYLDLDRFKYVNDTLGHAIGDKLLQSFCHIILQCKREGDFMARMGGDEFTLLVKGYKDRVEVKALAEKLIHRIKEPIIVEEYELFVTTSIGICFYPSDGEDAQSLMKNADAALHQAKEEGKNKFCIFNSEINKKARKTFSVEKELRRALNHNEFLIYYQPRVNIHSGKIIGAEALIRWNHPEWGMVSPGEFIPLSEETGLIIPIGEWIIREVCRQVKDWKAQGLPLIPISINISAKRFMQRDFITEIKQLLDDYDLDGPQLELEVTETSFISNPLAAQTTMTKLDELGVKVALDDFGTGYSSLSYLTQFKLHTLKIDRSFIQDLSKDDKVRVITTSIIQIAKGLGMEIVAEGVETEEQLVLLEQYGCEQVQGFIYSKPVPVDEFEQLITEGRLQPLGRS